MATEETEGGPAAQEEALQRALAAEHAAIHGYGFVGSHSTDAERTRATWHRDAHRRQRDQLRDALLALDSVPVPPESTYPHPETTDDAALAEFAVSLEEGCAQTCLELCGVTDPALRELATRLLAEATTRSLAWGAELPTYPGYPDDQP